MIREGYIINELIPDWRIILVTIMLFTQCYLIKNTLEELGARKKQYGILGNLVLALLSYYNKLLDNTAHSVIRYNLVIYGLKGYTAILRNTITSKTMVYLNTLIYNQIPRLLLSLTLVLDLILLQQINIFYKMLYLGVISLIYTILVALSRVYYNTILEKLLQESNILDLESSLQSLDLFTALTLIKRTHYYLKVNLVISSLQVLGWGYYLIFYLKARLLLLPLQENLLYYFLFPYSP